MLKIVLQHIPRKLPYEFFGKFIKMTNGFPAYTIKFNNQIIGFCFIRAYNPFPAFRETAEVTYFIDPKFSGKGIGKLALQKLENEASKIGIRTLLASITSENTDSLKFHKKRICRVWKIPSSRDKIRQKF